MDVYTDQRPGDALEQVFQWPHDLLHQVVFIVIRTAYKQLGTSDSLVEIRSTDLDTIRRFDFLIVDVLRLEGFRLSEFNLDTDTNQAYLDTQFS